MDISQTIRSYSSQPLTHQLMLSLLKDYKQPNAKLHGLQKEGILESVRKGLYVAGPALEARKPEPFLLANHILGPSYVSMDSALSFYGMIPERVYEISSMTTKATRQFGTLMGVYSYTRLPLPYYVYGIVRTKLADDQYALVASPEKALCDKIINTAGLLLRSPGNAREYVLENLRMEEESVKKLDTWAIFTWIPEAPKKESLSMLVKMIDSL